jgi:uncharacterized membrane protein YgdD (TMEM256/DUF423 family)
VRWSAWVGTGAVAGFLSVAAGAFGAHALEGRLDPGSLEVFEIASRYLMAHALALVLTGLLSREGFRAAGAGWAFLAGSALFCGSLFGLALTGWRPLGAITPIGGTAFLVGWALLAREALRQRRA